MNKKTKQNEEELDAGLEEAEAPAAPSAEEPARIAPVERRISFDQWAARSNIPAHNRRGRRAFVKNPDALRTLAEWNTLFKNF